MIHRTYFNKDATLYSGTDFNSGANPILKLIRGGGFKNTDSSKIIFNLDTSKIKTLIDNGEIGNDAKHILRIYNSLFINRDSMGYQNISPNNLPASFKLELYNVNQNWDEGRGYDYLGITDIGAGLELTEGVTFKQAKTNVLWNNDAFTYLSDFDMDLGSENIEIDLTAHIKNIINGTLISEGLMIKFKDDASSTPQVIDLFGKDTHTFFQPHLETVWEEDINDDRCDIKPHLENKLYCYLNIGNELVNADTLPTVKIIDSDDVTIREGVAVKEGKGIYSYTFDVSADLGSMDSGNFEDEWSFTYKNRPFKITNDFIIDIDSELFTSNHGTPREFLLSLSGITFNEKIKDKERRKLTITCKEYYGDTSYKPNKITFDLYVKQGNQKVYIIEDCKFNKTGNQFFLYMDFSWLIPQEYFIDLNVHSNGEVRTYEKGHFTLMNSKLANKINDI